MPIVLLNHGNAGAEMFGERAHSHSVVSQRNGGVEVAQAVDGALVDVARWRGICLAAPAAFQTSGRTAWSFSSF
jgi:hypothetical protein